MGYGQEEVQHHSRANDALYIYIYIYTVLRLLASAALKLIQLFARGRTNDALQQEGEEECLLYKRESDDGPLILASMMA